MIAQATADEKVARYRKLETAIHNGELDPKHCLAEVGEITATLSAYVDEFPPSEQPDVSKTLIDALWKREQFTPTVAPRKRGAA